MEQMMELATDLIPDTGFIIEFPEVSRAEAGRRARDLEQVLKAGLVDTGPNTSITLARADPAAQELGTLLAILLGAKATTEFAKGLSKWLSRNAQAKVVIRTRDGRRLVLSSMESKDVAAAIESLPKAAL
jgi:hypothetical protein